MKASGSNRSLSGYQKGVEDWYSPLLVRLFWRALYRTSNVSSTIRLAATVR